MAAPNRMLTDLSRLAEPQPDQYDTEVILLLARPRRTPAGVSPTVFDGQVAVRYACRSLPALVSLFAPYPDAPADHPNIAKAAEHVRSWPLAFTQCQRLLDSIHPAIYPHAPLDSAEIYRGSICHSDERLFGTVWATIFCPAGLAEAIVREMANQKLRVLARSFGHLDYAQYANVHVTALNIHMVRAEGDPVKRDALGRVLERNLSRIEEGYDQNGEAEPEFRKGFVAWTDRMIAEGRDLLGGGRRKAHGPSLATARSPVVFAYNGGIGDRLCNLPALRALASLFEGRLTLVCRTGDRDLYYRDLNLCAVHEIEFQQTDTGWLFNAAALGRRISACDLFLCINPWHTTSVSEVLAKFHGIETVGFFPEFRHHLACDYHGHAIDMAFAVPAYLCHGVRLNDYSQPPVISGAATAVAHGFRRSLGGRPILFVHTDSKPEKNWPRDRFRRVIDTFLSENPDVVALVVDVHGQGIGRTRFPDRVLPVRLPLEECFALLRDSDLFLGVDSCHLHAADLFGVPGVGLFGPTTSRRWGYRFSKFRYLQGAGRIDAIQVDEVCDALRGLSEECILRRYPIPDVTS